MNYQPKSVQRMPDTLVPQSVTTGPLPGSAKVYHHVEGTAAIAVPFREISLDPSAKEPPVRVYDASGPYTETGYTVDLSAGLPHARSWLAGRGYQPYDGRAVRPEDNGNVGVDKLVPACPAVTARPS